MLDDVLLQDWFKRGVKSFINVFKEDWLAESDACLYDLKELCIRELSWLDVVVFLHVLDPFVALRLWIYQKWPPFCLCANDTVFKREVVCW